MTFARLLAVRFIGAAVVALGIGGSLMLLLMQATPSGWLAGAAALGGGAAAMATVGFWQLRRYERSVQGLLHGLTAAATDPAPSAFSEEVQEHFAEIAGQLETALRRAESRTDRARAERDQLRTLLNSMVEGVVAVDAQQRITLVNAAAARLLQIPEKTALGRPIWELVRQPRIQRWITQTLQNAAPSGGEIELLQTGPRNLALHIVRLPVSDGSPGAVLVASDVSELRRLERVRQEFVANASHELKTPLASIKACAETLIDGAVNDPEYRIRFLETINAQAERLDALVQDMLSLARIETEAFTRETHAVSVAASAEACFNRHQQAADRKGVVYEIPDRGRPLTVRADEEALEQILDNLLDNAIKYTDPGGRVTLRWRPDGDEGLIEVEDTGIGIAQTQLPRIFERFYRVDRHRSRDMGGTGLGLSIVKHLAQAMGGTVGVHSELNVGSRFTVRLPRIGMDEPG